MKKLVAAAVIIAAFGFVAAASAADMPAAAPIYKAPVAVPVYNWTGLYVGLQGGAAWGRISGVQDFVGDVTGSFNGTSGLVGGTVGYNWQWNGNWVAGVEADLAWAHLTASGNDAAVFPTCTAGGLGTCGGTLESFGTARGRLGYSFGRTMVYGTIGAGFGQIHDFVSNAAGAGDATRWNAGFVFGGGVEAMLWQNWSAKLEYLHADLGDGPVASNFPSASGAHQTNDWRVDVVRAGLNYKFNWGL